MNPKIISTPSPAYWSDPSSKKCKQFDDWCPFHPQECPFQAI